MKKYVCLFLALISCLGLKAEEAKKTYRVVYTISMTCDDSEEFEALTTAMPKKSSAGTEEWKAHRLKELPLLAALIEKGNVNNTFCQITADEYDTSKRDVGFYVQASCPNNAFFDEIFHSQREHMRAHGFHSKLDDYTRGQFDRLWDMINQEEGADARCLVLVDSFHRPENKE